MHVVEGGRRRMKAREGGVEKGRRENRREGESTKEGELSLCSAVGSLSWLLPAQNKAGFLINMK
jgi:hypothetical protein